MTNPNHMFTRMAVFSEAYSEWWELYTLKNNEPGAVDKKITPGDIAISDGVEHAWWCMRLLPESCRKDVILATFPAVVRYIDLCCSKEDQKNIDTYFAPIQTAIALLQQFMIGAPVSVAHMTDICFQLNFITVPNNELCDLVAKFLSCTWHEKYAERILKLMRVIRNNAIKNSDWKECDQQVIDICKVFPSIG